MISKRSQFLLYLPFLVLKYFATPAVYDKKRDILIVSTGIPMLNYQLYTWTNIMARFVLCGLLIETFWAGHAYGLSNIIVASFLMPLFIISAAFSLNIIIFLKEATYLVNQIMNVHKRVGEFT